MLGKYNAQKVQLQYNFEACLSVSYIKIYRLLKIKNFGQQSVLDNQTFKQHFLKFSVLTTAVTSNSW